MFNNKRIYFLFIVLLLLSACSDNSGYQYKFTTVQQGTLTDSISSIGLVKPKKKIKIISPIDGKVKNILFQQGETVSKNCKLLELEGSLIQEKQINLQEKIYKAEEAYSLAKLEYEERIKTKISSQKLLSKKIITEKKLEEALLEFKKSQIKYDAARKILTNLKKLNAMLNKNIKALTVRSPCEGIILSINDQLFAKKGQILLEIYEPDKLNVVAFINEIDAFKIKELQPVYIKGYHLEDKIIKGVVYKIDSKIKESKLKVEINLLNPPKYMWVGSSMEIEIMAKTKKDVLYVPIETIVHEDHKNYLWVVSDNIIVKEEITIGITTSESAELLSNNISKGTKIVLPYSSNKLKDGLIISK